MIPEETRPTPDAYIPELWNKEFDRQFLDEFYRGSAFSRLIPKPIRRTWRERLFSLPWRPWVVWRWEEPKRDNKYEVYGDRVRIRRHDDDMIDSIKTAFPKA